MRMCTFPTNFFYHLLFAFYSFLFGWNRNEFSSKRLFNYKLKRRETDLLISDVIKLIISDVIVCRWCVCTSWTSPNPPKPIRRLCNKRGSPPVVYSYDFIAIKWSWGGKCKR